MPPVISDHFDPPLPISTPKKALHLVVAGVSYHKTDINIRNRFAITTDKIKQIYLQSHHSIPFRFFILSTCNRTEIYANTTDSQFVVNLFFRCLQANDVDMTRHVYLKEDKEAIQHLFRVAAGLDSQIVGDNEITGQLKAAFRLSKSYSCADGYLEKLVNAALETSRRVRRLTSISDGTTSVSYAVVQMLKRLFPENRPLQICLIGAGKIGKVTLKNLLQYMPYHRLVLINRTHTRARIISERCGVSLVSLDQSLATIRQSDVLIVATSAEEIVVTPFHIENSNVKVILDLSVPSNVDRCIRQSDRLLYLNIDSIAAIVNDTINKRTHQIPRALAIVDEYVTKFKNWEHRRHLFADVTE